MPPPPSHPLSHLIADRILVLDGAMGTMIQTLKLTEEHFRGQAFAHHPKPLQGCNDLLCLTQPDHIRAIHRDFLAAGADIIETNTFNATSIGLAEYELGEQTWAINEAAAQLAKAEAQAQTELTPARPRFVAGSMGPTNRTASLSPDVDNPAYRATSFDELVGAYTEQAAALITGGADLLLAETTFDTLNLKAALFAIEEAFVQTGTRLPVMASLTIVDQSGRTLSGQTLEAAWISIAHADLMAVGLNCALGAAQMRPFVEELARIAPLPLLCYPNAGLPNELGEYDEEPEHTASLLSDLAHSGLVNLVGGCCGTTPAHIAAIARAVHGLRPRTPAPPPTCTQLAGLEPLTLRADANFTVIGERTNVTGSRKFRRLITSDNFEEAVSVARQQVGGGANIIDVCMDEGLLDGEVAMTTFLHYVASEPDVARVPIMVDSSRFEVLVAGLKCAQGKCVVNSLSLKDGEAEFVRRAMLVRRFGVAVVVMAFDEAGQADNVERRVATLTRAYELLTQEAGFQAQDIIFDANVLAVATGIEEHNDYARSFFEAIATLHERFPAVHFSGGISNVSFAFRGNETVRRAIHAAFLYHAQRAGLDMGIVNAGQLELYDDVEPRLLSLVEDVLLNRRPDATEALLTYAQGVESKAAATTGPDLTWREQGCEARLSHALVHGLADYIEADLDEALITQPSPLALIEGPLMAGMNIVGDLFGEGKMFLPQVVKSARVMKRAVAHLQPLLEKEKRESGRDEKAAKGTLVIATVKGDVHDIGKNIVGVVLACNGYRIVDLGVMVPAHKIADAIEHEQADMVGLSGLITPSLDEMAVVARELNRRKITLPLLIGGATTSAKHTALKIAPAYEGWCTHVPDASKAATTAGQLTKPQARTSYMDCVRTSQEQVRKRYHRGKARVELHSFEQACTLRPSLDWSQDPSPTPSFTGVRKVELATRDLAELIDWTPLFSTWELRGVYPRILSDPKVGAQAQELFRDAQALLEQLLAEDALRPRAVCGIFPAHSDDNDVVLTTPEGRSLRVPMLRQQRSRGRDIPSPTLCLADFIAPHSASRPDHIGAFVVSSGHGAAELAAHFVTDHDDYRAIMVKALADRLAEAAAEQLHLLMRQWWNHGEDPALSAAELHKARYQGIRPAPGYPACPDHRDKTVIFELLRAVDNTGVELTESFAMQPAASVCGWVLAHPQARYFSLGPVGRDQIADYARRRGETVAECEKWLRPNLGY